MSLVRYSRAYCVRRGMVLKCGQRGTRIARLAMKANCGVLLVLALSSLAAIDARPAAAEIYRPWCVQYTDKSGATNCGFTSYEQCMMTARGAGATCVQNPWYLQYGSGQKAAESTGRAERPRKREYR